MKCHDVVAMKNNLLENVFGTLQNAVSDQDQHSFH